MARFLAAAQLSEHLMERPDGSLLAVAVPIARTGQLEYQRDEVDPAIMEGSSSAIALMERDEDELFSARVMASFEGLPFTLDHPPLDVTPDNWAQYARGHVQNVRRGTGADSDLLLADIVISDRDAIKAVRSGLREISCGYDAEYIPISPGRGKQARITGNHIALVPAGRNGPRVAIRDRDKEKDTMEPRKTKSGLKSGFLDTLFGRPRIQKAIRDELEAELQDGTEAEAPPAVADEGEETQPVTDDGEEALILLRSINEKMDRLLGGAQDSDPDPEARTEDSDPDESAAILDNSDPAPEKAQDRRTVDQGVLAAARILAPSLRFQASDAASAVKKTALSVAMSEPRIARIVDSVAQGAPLRRMSGPVLDACFAAATAVAKDSNNRQTSQALTTKDSAPRNRKPQTPTELQAEINKIRDRKGSK